jgi:hypothetical protein
LSVTPQDKKQCNNKILKGSTAYLIVIKENEIFGTVLANLMQFKSNKTPFRRKKWQREFWRQS